MGRAMVFFAGLMGALTACGGASASVLDRQLPPGNAPSGTPHKRNISWGWGVGSPNSSKGCGRLPRPKDPETIADFRALSDAQAKRDRKAALRLLQAAKRTNGVAFAHAPRGAHYSGVVDVG